MRLKRGRRTVKRATVSPSRSDNVTLPVRRKLRRGRYVMTITVEDALGERKKLAFAFRV
jgi:hypothetical protein